MTKIAILGCGSRGATTYGDYLNTLDNVNISAICDIDENKLAYYQKKYNVDPKFCFNNSNDFFKAGKLADILIIATLDQDHYEHAMNALDLNYHLLLEKPISPNIKECIEIEKKALEKNREVVVCHVLRYTTFYRKIKEIVDSGVLGDIIHINSTENVGYWHQAHSFVRGNWNNSEQTSPMILQKCCHDIDILNFLVNKNVKTISSFGSLNLFKKDNAPIDSADYCYDCKVKDTCPFNAVKYYVDSVKDRKGPLGWPYDVVILDPTPEKLLETIKHGPYGRCVYKCDNNVVDHQVVNILYDNNTTASHTMCAFSKECYREIRIYGTRGDLTANTLSNTISYNQFIDHKEVNIDVSKLATDLSGHMGGDKMMLDEFINLVNHKKANLDSSIQKSVLSHIICMASEQSRLNNGINIDIEKYKKEQ